MVIDNQLYDSIIITNNTDREGPWRLARHGHAIILLPNTTLTAGICACVADQCALIYGCIHRVWLALNNLAYLEPRRPTLVATRSLSNRQRITPYRRRQYSRGHCSARSIGWWHGECGRGLEKKEQLSADVMCSPSVRAVRITNNYDSNIIQYQ